MTRTDRAAADHVHGGLPQGRGRHRLSGARAAVCLLRVMIKRGGTPPPGAAPPPARCAYASAGHAGAALRRSPPRAPPESVSRASCARPARRGRKGKAQRRRPGSASLLPKCVVEERRGRLLFERKNPQTAPATWNCGTTPGPEMYPPCPALAQLSAQRARRRGVATGGASPRRGAMAPDRRRRGEIEWLQGRREGESEQRRGPGRRGRRRRRGARSWPWAPSSARRAA